MNRSTWLGRLFRRDREAARAEVVRVLTRTGGNVKRAAIEMGFDRRYLFRILWRESLWHILDEIRAKAAREEAASGWQERTRAALRE